MVHSGAYVIQRYAKPGEVAVLCKQLPDQMAEGLSLSGHWGWILSMLRLFPFKRWLIVLT